MKSTFHLVLLVSFLLPAYLASSQTEDFTTEASFFKAQEEVYQRWLDHSGLGKTLKIQSLVVKPEELKLYLQFPYTQIDSVTSAWNQLKFEFSKKTSLSLEQALFYKMTALLEIEDTSASIQLYDTYDTNIAFCFKRKIFSRDGIVTTEEDNCKAKVVNIDFDATDFKKFRQPKNIKIKKKKLSPKEIRERYPRELIFEKVFAYAKNKFERTTCEHRNPKVVLLNSKGVLRFKVTDLCQEVLEEGNPKTCEILHWFGHDCNWIKRERLIFTFTYVETPQGFNLYTIIDGAYGSGYYEKVKRGGYHNMEIDFDDELEEYVHTFKEEIRLLLRKL